MIITECNHAPVFFRTHVSRMVPFEKSPGIKMARRFLNRLSLMTRVKLYFDDPNF